MLAVPCGGGKTVMALHIAAALGVRTVVCVHKEFLATQWLQRIAQFLPGARAAELRGAKLDEADVHVAMLQTLGGERGAGIAAALRGTGLLIVDEAHHVSAETFARALHRVPARYTLGLSATPRRATGWSACSAGSWGRWCSRWPRARRRGARGGGRARARGARGGRRGRGRLARAAGERAGRGRAAHGRAGRRGARAGGRGRAARAGAERAPRAPAGAARAVRGSRAGDVRGGRQARGARARGRRAAGAGHLPDGRRGHGRARAGRAHPGHAQGRRRAGRGARAACARRRGRAHAAGPGRARPGARRRGSASRRARFYRQRRYAAALPAAVERAMAPVLAPRV